MSKQQTTGQMDGQQTTRQAEALSLAQQAFHDLYAQCFWYLRKDMKITAADIPEIVRGLRHNGGRRGLQLAAQLCR